MATCPKHENIDLDLVVSPEDGGHGLYCPNCNVTYDLSDLEDEPAVCDPDHLNPAKGGNRASDDYW